jgi:hypothetical protein
VLTRKVDYTSIKIPKVSAAPTEEAPEETEETEETEDIVPTDPAEDEPESHNDEVLDDFLNSL